MEGLSWLCAVEASESTNLFLLMPACEGIQCRYEIQPASSTARHSCLAMQAGPSLGGPPGVFLSHSLGLLQ